MVADAFTLEHFEPWAFGLRLEEGSPFVLEEWQQSFVADLFVGRSLNWLVVPEGNGKTSLLAAIGLYGLRFAEGASIPIAASSRDQTRIMYRQMKGFIQRSDLRKQDKDGLWFEPFDGYRRIDLRRPMDRNRRGDTLGTIEIHAADAGTADGVIPYPFAFLDELHRHPDLALYRTWSGKLNKRGAQLVVISTAGEPGGDFENARAAIKAKADATEIDGAFGRFTTERLVMHEYMVRDPEQAADLDVVKAANPLKAVDAAYLKVKHADPTMTDRHWRRFTCNIATVDTGTDPYLEAWDDLADPDFSLEPDAVVCLGGDGSRTWDTTAIAWAHCDPDGVVWADARVFSVRPDIEEWWHVLHAGSKIDFDEIEAFILDRFDAFTVQRAAYDPRYLERSMEIVDARLPDAAIVPVEPSSKHMRDALQAMFTLAAEGKLRHRGDPVLRNHILNTGCERGFSGEIRRVRKIDSRLPIDAVPALALASWQASLVPQTAQVPLVAWR